MVRSQKNINSWWNEREPSLPQFAVDLDPDQDYWNCYEWRTYYTRIKNALGKDAANQYFLTDIDNLGMFADFRFCLLDCDFIEWLESEDIPSVSYYWLGADNPIITAKCLGESAASSISDTAQSVLTWGKFVLPALVIGGAFIIYQNRDKFKEAGDDLMKIYK